MFRNFAFTVVALFTLIGWEALATDPQFEAGLKGVQSRAGCYLVDYSFMETESLKPGYTVDNRVYDVNGDKSVKEWIYIENISPTRLRLQHVLFTVGLDGVVNERSIMKHTGEDWEYNASFLYDFRSPNLWEVKQLAANQWTRKITNLDDGLRYQCASTWSLTNAYPEWTCDNYSPIPGRETRDMDRDDYNTLQRSTRIISYGNNWLEREANVKTIDTNGVKTPLAKELGKNWYTRLPDAECAKAQDFVKPRQAFWTLVRETWDVVLIGDSSFSEKTTNGRSRYSVMSELERKYITQDLSAPGVRSAAQADILKVINSYRQ